MSFTTLNPATGATSATHVAHTRDQLEQMLARAARLQQEWAGRRREERLAIISRAGVLLRERAGDLATLMAQEMGKPCSQGVAEAGKCAWVCEYYAEHGLAQLADQSIETEAASSYVSFQPLGIVLAIMPWNFPLWQVIRFAVPALLAGNGGLIKHAPATFGSSARLVRIFEDAGMPKGLLVSIHARLEDVPGLIADPRVAAVTLTGSTAAGRAVAEQAGRHLKKCVLELGGSDAHVILEDADLERAAELCVTSRMINNGQSCIAAKRLIAVEPVHDRLLELVVKGMSAYVMSDPLEAECRLGPLARLDLRETLHGQVARSMQAGARLCLGGEVPQRSGAWYPATVLADVLPGMAAFDEELFGPVAVVIRARDERHALELANLSAYGLGGAVYSRDAEHAEQLARERLHAGSCFVNSLVRSDPRLPFGGVRESGFGRELSVFGLREFVNIKTIVVDH